MVVLTPSSRGHVPMPINNANWPLSGHLAAMETVAEGRPMRLDVETKAYLESLNTPLESRQHPFGMSGSCNGRAYLTPEMPGIAHVVKSSIVKLRLRLSKPWRRVVSSPPVFQARPSQSQVEQQIKLAPRRQPFPDIVTHDRV